MGSVLNIRKKNEMLCLLLSWVLCELNADLMQLLCVD